MPGATDPAELVRIAYEKETSTREAECVQARLEDDPGGEILIDYEEFNFGSLPS